MALSAYKKLEFSGWFFEISRPGRFEWVCSAGHKNGTSGNEKGHMGPKRAHMGTKKAHVGTKRTQVETKSERVGAKKGLC